MQSCHLHFVMKATNVFDHLDFALTNQDICIALMFTNNNEELIIVIFFFKVELYAKITND